MSNMVTSFRIHCSGSVWLVMWVVIAYLTMRSYCAPSCDQCKYGCDDTGLCTPTGCKWLGQYGKRCEKGCGDRITTLSGTIKPPWGIKPRPDYAACKWTVVAPRDYIITLTMISMDLPARYATYCGYATEHVRISINDETLHFFCGSYSFLDNTPGRISTSKSGSLSVHLYTQHSSGKYTGFVAEFVVTGCTPGKYGRPSCSKVCNCAYGSACREDGRCFDGTDPRPLPGTGMYEFGCFVFERNLPFKTDVGLHQCSMIIYNNVTISTVGGNPNKRKISAVKGPLLRRIREYQRYRRNGRVILSMNVDQLQSEIDRNIDLPYFAKQIAKCIRDEKFTGIHFHRVRFGNDQKFPELSSFGKDVFFELDKLITKAPPYARTYSVSASLNPEHTHMRKAFRDARDALGRGRKDLDDVTVHLTDYDYDRKQSKTNRGLDELRYMIENFIQGTVAEVNRWGKDVRIPLVRTQLLLGINTSFPMYTQTGDVKTVTRWLSATDVCQLRDYGQWSQKMCMVEVTSWKQQSGTIYYEDEKSILNKIEFVKIMDLHGVVLWLGNTLYSDTSSCGWGTSNFHMHMLYYRLRQCDQIPPSNTTTCAVPLSKLKSKIYAPSTCPYSDACHEPISDPAKCPGSETRWRYWYDSKSHKCKDLFYKGCFGSYNMFPTELSCLRFCVWNLDVIQRVSHSKPTFDRSQSSSLILIAIISVVNTV